MLILRLKNKKIKNFEKFREKGTTPASASTFGGLPA